jgi:hypothetical protein
LAQYYGAAGRAYPAYVSLALLPAMVRAVQSRLPVLVRVAAGLLALGGAAIGLSLLFPFVPPEWGAIKFVINYTAVLCYVFGLALIWAARVRNKRTSPAARRRPFGNGDKFLNGGRSGGLRTNWGDEWWRPLGTAPTQPI